MAQTQACTPASLQPVPSCDKQQLSLPPQAPQSAGQELQSSAPLQAPSPQTGGATQPHRSTASLAQIESQVTSQQKPSMAQTAASQLSSSQPSEPFAAQQLPVQPPHWSASPAQSRSQRTLQQYGSIWQTQTCTAASSHPGTLLSMQQESARASPTHRASNKTTADAASNSRILFPWIAPPQSNVCVRWSMLRFSSSQSKGALANPARNNPS